MNEYSVLLATDIVDSTRLAEKLGDAAMSDVWRSHDRIARDLLRAWHGREIGRSDGFLLRFATVSDAVNYALGYHGALSELGVPLRARAGLHVGRVTLRDNRAEDIELGAKPSEIHGLAVAIAVRTMSLAGGGQTLLTSPARMALQGKAFPIRSHGHWCMKGLEEPVELFELGAAESPGTPPPDSEKVYRVFREGDLWLPLARVPHSLPAERDVFIGRRQTLAALGQRFDSGARLVSVVGIGGTGKTRFAQRFGWTSLGDFTGGVWFCDLSQARSLDGVVHAVAQGLHLPLASADPLAQICTALSARGRCLAILDNFEQVSHLAEQTIGRWLEGAREARFVVTSRELLGIPGEERFTLDPLLPSEASALFVQRASAGKRDFRATPEDRVAIDQLVGLLDNLPLAIELAAARIRIMPPRMLLARMSERLPVVVSVKGRPKRHATLRSMFDWSWDLLLAPEKTALGQLSVFEGSFTLAAAEEVIDLSACIEAATPMDVVQSLVDKSLVRDVGDRRFGLLGTVKEYAAERLVSDAACRTTDPTPLLSAQKRHWRHFATLDETEAVADGCADVDNLIAACRRASDARDSPGAVGALAGAWAVLKLRGPFRGGLELGAMVAAIPGLSESERATIDWVTGSALDQLGRVAEAHAKFRSGLESSRRAGDRRCEARLACAMSDQLADEGNIDAARKHLDGALLLARELRDRTLECNVLNRLGVVHHHCAELERAHALFEAGLELAQELGDKHLEGGVVGNLGSLYRSMGQLDWARERFETALLLAQEIGDRRWEGNARCNLGLLHHDQGRTGEARSQFEAALRMSREMGHTRLECTVLCNLGIVVEAQGSLDAARDYYEQAVAAAHGLADHRSEGQFRGYLGLLYARLGRFEDAWSCLSLGEGLLGAVSDSLSLGLLLCSRASAEDMAGKTTQAQVTLRRAEAIARNTTTGPESELGRALASLRQSLATVPDLYPRA